MPGNVEEQHDPPQLEKEPRAMAGTAEVRLKRQLYSKLLFPDSYTVLVLETRYHCVSPGWP